MSATYKITAVHGSREWQPRQGGTNVDFTVTLEGVEQQHVLTQKKDGPHQPPKPGDEIFGRLEDGGQWPSGDPKPPKLKREQQDGGGGGWQRTPDKGRDFAWAYNATIDKLRLQRESGHTVDVSDDAILEGARALYATRQKVAGS